MSYSRQQTLRNRSRTKARRQSLRSDPTRAEASLWFLLRKGYPGSKFRRQYGVGPYIVDFFCPSARLVIEIDGDSHYTDAGRHYDERRDAYLESCGLRVLRVTNQDVINNRDAVAETIMDWLHG